MSLRAIKKINKHFMWKTKMKQLCQHDAENNAGVTRSKNIFSQSNCRQFFLDMPHHLSAHFQPAKIRRSEI